MPDFQTAALMAAGLGLHDALMWTALPLVLATAGLFYFFALRIARSRLAAVLACFLFLFNGGFGFVYLFADWRASGKGCFEFWRALPVNYTNLWARDIHWVNLVADGLLPQRTLLFGLPAALMIFTLFAVVWEQAGTEEKTGASATRLLASAGVLAGLLPLFHLHAYFGVVFVSVALFALRPGRRWLAFWTPAALLAAPQLYGAGVHAAGGGFVHLQPGWMMSAGSSFAIYLLRNFGVPLVLALPALVVAPREWRKFYVAFLALFAFALSVAVSPNVFDNVKLMYPWHAVNSVLVGSLLARLARARRRVLLAPLALLLFAASIASGVTALQSNSLSRSRLFGEEEIDAADYVREHAEPRALFLTAPVFNQPVLCLAGRPVVRAPTFWLWSHGYEFREREADVRRIYAGSRDALELLSYYHVDYVYLGEAERRDLRADAGFFDRNFTVFYRAPSIAIYDTRRARSDDAKDLTGNNGPPRPISSAASASGSRNALESLAPRELAARVGRDPAALLAEFPRTSFFVYRLLKAATGRTPREAEFMDAMRVVGRGLFVGRAGWEQRLVENRRTLAESLSAGDEFKSGYAGRTNTEFVAVLLANAGLDAKSFDAATLVRRLDAGEESRASALARVAEDRVFYAREYDAAFVLVHFFGYLGRNPGDAPDRDAGGFDFWRGVLARTRDYRSISRAFLESDEYKNRPLEP
jgi:hypothetical protein